MRQAYDYWQDQPGNYPNAQPNVPLSWPSLGSGTEMEVNHHQCPRMFIVNLDQPVIVEILQMIDQTFQNERFPAQPPYRFLVS